MQSTVCQTLNIHKVALAERYLGLPTEVGRNLSGLFEYLPNQIKGRIEGWCGREASCAGREVLIKSIAQAVPTYSMSCFRLPINTCNKMRSAMVNYWWGSSADNRRMHWMSWERLTQPKCYGGMGFRDLRCFNIAMLGKQGWWLITRSDSLCARVLKGRYFHDSDFMNARRKKHASSTWRAILAGREVLQDGLIRRVADGASTSIWEDRWIANHFNGKPITPSDGQDMVQVSELITASGIWDEALIREHLVPVDAEAILRQPLCNNGEDFWAWDAERSGVYSVKSAYRLLYKKKTENLNGQDPSTSADGSWKKIWRLEVPPKVKVFWWRVVHEFLPTRQILWKRHIEPVAHCDVCGAPEESINHVLLNCTIAKTFWHQARIGIGVKIPNLNPQTWATDLISDICSRRDTGVILCGMWALWMRRNSRKHGAPVPSVHQAVMWVRDTAFDLWQISHPTIIRDVPQKEMRWRKPETGWVKLNSDAAFQLNDFSGAAACIIRDDQGQFMAAQAQWYDRILDVCTMEAMACRDGLQLVAQIGAQRVAMETDCLDLVNLWNKRDGQRSALGPLLAEIDALSLAFHSFSFSYVSRNCNRVAHVLAKQVSKTHRSERWHVTPACVADTLISEASAG